MPLRDHFRPPISTRSSWEGLHGGWPMTMVQRLSPHLPENYTAEPRVHLGPFFEIDVGTFENESTSRPMAPDSVSAGGPATWAPPAPTWAVDADLTEQSEYEVLVYDRSRGRTLVAAVEIVSPANKDRPNHREAFVGKCAFLLQKGVCVSIVDLVTIRNFNLYADLLQWIGQSDPAFAENPPAIYAVTCRGRSDGRRLRVETWAYPLQIGQSLPTLPVWLSEDLGISLELEKSYEDTCRVLRIG